MTPISNERKLKWNQLWLPLITFLFDDTCCSIRTVTKSIKRDIAVRTLLNWIIMRLSFFYSIFIYSAWQRSSRTNGWICVRRTRCCLRRPWRRPTVSATWWNSATGPRSGSAASASSKTPASTSTQTSALPALSVPPASSSFSACLPSLPSLPSYTLARLVSWALPQFRGCLPILRVFSSVWCIDHLIFWVFVSVSRRIAANWLLRIISLVHFSIIWRSSIQ